MEQINLINANILSISLGELLKNLHNGILVTPNVDHIMHLQKNEEFYRAYQAATWVICDSKILQLAGAFLGRPFKEAIPGSSFLPAYYDYHRNNPSIKLFLLGGKPGVVATAMSNINNKVGREMVVGAHSPSFDFENNDSECESIVELINASGANVLVVGLGAPKQETWIMKHKPALKSIDLCMALGATIDFEAGFRKRAPRIFQTLYLEWLYRLCQEPTRLWKRYLVDDLPFFWYLLQQRFGVYRDPFERNERPMLTYLPKPNI